MPSCLSLQECGHSPNAKHQRFFDFCDMTKLHYMMLSPLISGALNILHASDSGTLISNCLQKHCHMLPTKNNTGVYFEVSQCGNGRSSRPWFSSVLNCFASQSAICWIGKTAVPAAPVPGDTGQSSDCETKCEFLKTKASILLNSTMSFLILLFTPWIQHGACCHLMASSVQIPLDLCHSVLTSLVLFQGAFSNKCISHSTTNCIFNTSMSIKSESALCLAAMRWSKDILQNCIPSEPSYKWRSY